MIVVIVVAVALLMILLLFSLWYVYMHVCRVADGGANVFAFPFLADSNP